MIESFRAKMNARASLPSRQVILVSFKIASLSECTFHDSAQNTSGSTRICVMMNYNHPVKSRLDNKIKMKVKIVKIQIV